MSFFFNKLQICFFKKGWIRNSWKSQLDPDPEFTIPGSQQRCFLIENSFCLDDGAQVTSVTTQTGNLVLFRHNVAAKRKKPAKPNQTLSLASEGSGGKEVAHQMAVLGSRVADPEDPQVTFAYG